MCVGLAISGARIDEVTAEAVSVWERCQQVGEKLRLLSVGEIPGVKCGFETFINSSSGSSTREGFRFYTVRQQTAIIRLSVSVVSDICAQSLETFVIHNDDLAVGNLILPRVHNLFIYWA